MKGKALTEDQDSDIMLVCWGLSHTSEAIVGKY
jgi:hypothetical protein